MDLSMWSLKTIARLIALSLLWIVATTFQEPRWQAPTMRAFVGINTMAQAHWEQAARFGAIREFHLWSDDIGTPTAPLPFQCPFEPGYTGQKLRWNPSYNGNKWIRYDDFYGLLQGRVSPVLMGTAPVMNGVSTRQFLPDAFQKPICRNDGQWTDPNWHTQAAAYHAQTIWQSLFAARFGVAPPGGFSENLKTIAAPYMEREELARLGAGMVKYLENWNEPDAAWWDGLNVNAPDRTIWQNPRLTKYFFSPAQYAAMLSANYDGHQRRADFWIQNADGTTAGCWGIKNWSPATQVVFAAPSDLRRAYVQRVLDCFADPKSPAHRTDSYGQPRYPFDVISFHHYSTEQNPPIFGASGAFDATFLQFFDGVHYFSPFGNRGIHPEAPSEDLKNRVRVLLEAFGPASHYNLTNKEFWISEFGYDTHADPFDASGVETHALGPQRSLNTPSSMLDSIARQTVQGQWLVRSILEMAAARGGGRGLDKVMIYNLQDDVGRGEAQFSHAGIIDGSGRPKQSWFHLMTFLDVLGDYRFVPTPRAAMKQPRFFLSQNPAALGSPLAESAVRVYRFERVKPDNLRTSGTADCTLVLWSPTASGVVLTGMLRLPPSFATRQVLKIEVVDQDENGRRSLIPEGDIVRAGEQVFIKNLTINETPIYLKIYPDLSDFQDFQDFQD